MGIAGQVEIHYNTNGTQYPDGAEDIWQHFKTVEIAFSIDDVEGRFEIPTCQCHVEAGRT
jgi:hypothetical protein